MSAPNALALPAALMLLFGACTTPGADTSAAGSGGSGGRAGQAAESGSSAGSGGSAGGSGSAGSSGIAGGGGSAPDAGMPDAAYSGDASTNPQPDGETRIVGVGSFGLRGRSKDGASWSYCGSPEQADEHTPELLRAVAYGDGVFVAVGGDANGRVMRSLDGEHWDEDVHPLDACPDEDYPSSCSNWMGAVAYLDGVWLAGGGNGATMRSEDAGRSWRGLHKGFPEKHIRSLGAGAGRFIAGTDGGGLYVTADHGESWKAKSAWSNAPAYASLQVVFGKGTFLAFSEEGDACFVSSDLGESWQPCAAAAQGGSSYLFADSARYWAAAKSDAYATSADGLSWNEQPAAVMPRRLLFNGSEWYGRSDGTVYRTTALDAFEVVATHVPDFRAWTSGRVLAANLAVASSPACVDRR